MYLHVLAGTGVRKIGTVACGSVLLCEVYSFSIKYHYSDILLKYIAMFIVEYCNRLFRCSHT